MDHADLTRLGCGLACMNEQGRLEVNDVLAAWLGGPVDRLDMVLTPASFLYWHTNVTPLLATQGHARDLGLEVRADPPVPVLANVARADGQTQIIFHRFDERRRFERTMAEARAAARRQEERVQALEEADRFRRDFINSAAHELATPMTPIQMQLHLLASHVTGDGERQLAVLAKNIQQLGQFVKNLQFASRIQSDSLRAAPTQGDLCGPVRDVLATWPQPAPQITMPAPVTAWFDGAAVATAFRHLLDNAARFGDGTVRVRVEAEPPRIVVEDDGIGIDPARLQEVGRPFARVHDTSRITSLGAGLGLHVCKGLMEAMGGRLTVTSEGLGKGTQAVLSFLKEPPPPP